MDTFKNICLGVVHGLWDSIRGMTLLLHIDEEIHRLNMEKANERLQKQRQRQQRRSPSPTPSSASAMEREEQEAEDMARVLRARKNADERHIDTVLKTHAAEPISRNQPKAEKKIAKQVLKCCLLNGGLTWASILIFEQLILPTLRLFLTLFYAENSSELHVVWSWLHSILSIVFGMMWVLPIFLLSKVVSSLWFADIANAAYRVRKGRPQMIPNLSKLVADFLFSMLVQALFLVQSMLINLVPVRYVGQTLYFLHVSLLYSLYSFEYKWFNMGWELHRRLSYIENNWPYFFGFGIPLTVLTNMTNSVIVSSCIFSIFFPLFILSGNEAKPLVGTTETPLRLFSPVVFFSNLFFSRPNKLSTNEQSGSHAANSNDAQQQLLLQQQQQHQLMLQQQLIEHKYRQRSLQRENKEKQQQQQQQYRYQQPPQLHVSPSSINSSGSSSQHTPERSSNRGARYGGMRPLIPTPVPGAPTSVLSSKKAR